jgi:hypothetical protein
MTAVQMLGAILLVSAAVAAFCVRHQIPGWLDRVAEDVN